MFEGELGVPKSEHRVALQEIKSLQSQLDDAMHKETAMCLELEQVRGQLDREQIRVRYLVRKNDEQEAEIARIKAQLDEERRIGDWVVSGAAILCVTVAKNGRLIPRDEQVEHLTYFTGNEDETKEIPITNGDWRKAVLEVMDE